MRWIVGLLVSLLVMGCVSRPDPEPATPAPESLTTPEGPAGDDLDAWGLHPSAPDWSGGFDWTPGEIAAARDLPRGTVNSRLRRGLDKLKEELE